MSRPSTASSIVPATSRRAFLGGATVLGAGLALAGFSTSPRSALARLNARAPEPAPAVPLPADAVDTKFATLIPINTWSGGGVWAIISKWGQPATLCNGGIIAGRDAVVVVEGFNSFAGSQWAARLARQLTGRDPSHVIISHYHFDHVDGLGGYLALPEPPSIISTPATRQRMAQRGMAGGGTLFSPAPAAKFPGLSTSAGRCLLPDAVVEDPSKPLTIDLGGKLVTLRERSGHTDSDLNIEIDAGGKDGQRVVFAGDMIFNKVFPVYLDAKPRALRANVAEVIAHDGGRSIVVPGHGALTTGAELKPFVELIDHLSAAGAKAKAAGLSAKDAAAAYAVPESLKDYTPSNPMFTQLAFDAIYRELDAPK